MPSGCVTFVSQLYSGGISDKEITLLERRDNVIADRGFVRNDQLEPLGCTLNIPPFLNNQGQFSEDQVKEHQEIANLRIHVERAISRIKTFKILQNVFPINQAGLLNQSWTVYTFGEFSVTNHCTITNNYKCLLLAKMQDTYRCISEICCVNVNLSMKIQQYRNNQQPIEDKKCFKGLISDLKTSRKIMAKYDVINHMKVRILSL